MAFTSSAWSLAFYGGVSSTMNASAESSAVPQFPVPDEWADLDESMQEVWAEAVKADWDGEETAKENFDDWIEELDQNWASIFASQPRPKSYGIDRWKTERETSWYEDLGFYSRKSEDRVEDEADSENGWYFGLRFLSQYDETGGWVKGNISFLINRLDDLTLYLENGTSPTHHHEDLQYYQEFVQGYTLAYAEWTFARLFEQMDSCVEKLSTADMLQELGADEGKLTELVARVGKLRNEVTAEENAGTTTHEQENAVLQSAVQNAEENLQVLEQQMDILDSHSLTEIYIWRFESGLLGTEEGSDQWQQQLLASERQEIESAIESGAAEAEQAKLAAQATEELNNLKLSHAEELERVGIEQEKLAQQVTDREARVAQLGASKAAGASSETAASNDGENGSPVPVGIWVAGAGIPAAGFATYAGVKCFSKKPTAAKKVAAKKVAAKKQAKEQAAAKKESRKPKSSGQKERRVYGASQKAAKKSASGSQK